MRFREKKKRIDCHENAKKKKERDTNILRYIYIYNQNRTMR
jgi:hypothetical protein